jgi:diguanylate cyclase (GGDEF)-like protein
MRLGLRGKIALLTALVALLVMGATSAAGAYFFAREYGSALESRSLAVAKGLKMQLERLLQFGIELENLVGFDEQLREALRAYPGVEEAMVVGLDGKILFHSDAARPRLARADGALLQAMSGRDEAIVRGVEAMAGKVSAVVPVTTPGGARGIVVVAFPESLIGERVRSLWAVEFGIGLAFLVAGVAILLLAVSAYVTRPVARLIGAVRRIEGRPLDEAEAAPVETRDELGRLAESFNRLLAGLKQTTVSKREIERRNADISLLSEMNQVLLSALTLEEAYELLPRFARRLFPASEGALYVLAGARSRLEAKAAWGAASADGMAPPECWALRRSQVHVVRDGALDLACQHAERAGLGARPQICTPLSSLGEAIGSLHLVFPGGHAISPEEQRLAGMLAEQLSFALGNLRLREALREHSVRDSLTGLFNRRYLEETLERELRRAARKGQPLAVVMLDVDHFKRVNDTFGHDAGDAVLRSLAATLRAAVRGSDIICRYGGEEFIAMLPEAGLETALQRAEALRAAVARTEVSDGRQKIGPVTLSLGVAAYPEHGETPAALIARADEALYAAKREGRNRVVVATPSLAPLAA